MAAIKSIDQSSDKWVRRASVAGPDYQAGVTNPRAPWAAAAVAGKMNWQTGVQGAITRDAFAKGVTNAGDEKWRTAAIRKGPGRFAEGVAIGKDEWQKGFAPYQAAISAVVLPPRGAKGDPKNIERVRAVATTLRTLREKAGK